MAKFKIHKDCWAQTEIEDEGATYILCVCGEYVKVEYRRGEDEEASPTGTF